MKLRLILCLISFFLGARSFALDIVYPKKNPVVISASSTFFIGSATAGEKVKINDVEIKVHPSGAFAQSVPLNLGKNNFVINSGEDTINFVIERPEPSISPSLGQISKVLVEYPVMGDFYVKGDNAPLRITPVDGGINRISHLPEGMPLLINGEKGDFYRVYLNSQLNAWIAKSNMEQKGQDLSKNPPVEIKKFEINESRDYCEYSFELAQKVPFAVKEEQGLSLNLFNVKSEDKNLAIADNTLSFHIPMPKLFGYKVYWQGDKFILKVKKSPEIDVEKPLKNIMIAVDAGHGGSECGAIGCCGDKEKDINLAISQNLHKELENRGAKVVMTRHDDVNVSLQDRVKFADEKEAMVLLSIHANAIPDGQDPLKNRGTSVYYYHNQAKNLAENILSSMTTELGTQNDKVRQGSLALVRPTSSVSVLIEVAYIINPDDYALLLDKDFQKNCAKAIADGVENYLLNK